VHQLTQANDVGGWRDRPFEITIQSNATLLMDIHCHLARTEVIGYVAGTWDKQTRRLHVIKVCVCRRF
jgi:protein MYSM1